MRKWVCDVCGYIHEGDKPPAECPICGVGPEQFSLVNEQQPSSIEPEKRWKCDVCDYVHVGEHPPEVCPLCGVGREHFHLLTGSTQALTIAAIQSANQSTANAALDLISYGLYVVTSIKDGKLNGQTANSVLQLTSQPPQIAVCINKRNLTHEYIEASGKFTVSILANEHIDLVKTFGYQSGRTIDKFAAVEYILGQNGCPILKNCLAYLEAEVIPDKVVDVGTHTIFVAKVTSGQTAASQDPLTYAHYRKVK